MKFPRLLLNSGFSQDGFISSTFAISQKNKKQGKHSRVFLILILIFVQDCRETQKYVQIWFTFWRRNNTFKSLFRTNSLYGTGILSPTVTKLFEKTPMLFVLLGTKLCCFWGLGLLFLLFIIQYSSVSCSRRFEAVPLCWLRFMGTNAAAI